MVRRDPFRIKLLASSASARLGWSYASSEHAVAACVSLGLTLAFNVSAIVLCSAFSAVVFPASARSQAELLTYGDLRLIGGNNNSSFSASYDDVVSAARNLQLGDRALSSLWRRVSVTFAPWTASFAFPGVWSLLSYVLGCAPFAILDLLDLPGLRKYKLQPDKHPAKPGSWKHTVGTTLMLQCLFPIPAMIGQTFFRGPWTYGYSTKSGIFCMRDCVWGASVFPVAPCLKLWYSFSPAWWFSTSATMVGTAYTTYLVRSTETSTRSIMNTTPLSCG